MFLFYVLTFFKEGDIIQGGTLFKGGQNLRKYGKCTYYEKRLNCIYFNEDLLA